MQFIELQMHKDTTNFRTEQTKMHTNVFLDAPVKKKLIRGGTSFLFYSFGVYQWRGFDGRDCSQR